MKDYIEQIIRKKGLRLSLLLTIVLDCANALLVIYYRNVIIKNSDISQQIQGVKDGINSMEYDFRSADIGVRAYIIKQMDQLLGPYNSAKKNYIKNLDQLENDLKNLSYDLSKCSRSF